MVLRSLAESATSQKGTEAEGKDFDKQQLRVVMVGTGGAGCNCINRLARKPECKADMVAVNTDRQHLAIVNDCAKKVLIGKEVTRGLGAGGYPEVGRKSAEVSHAYLEEALVDTDLLFLSAGMGGGTGTGSAPVIAEIAKSQGAIVVSMVTMPFKLERARVEKAKEGVEELLEVSDSVIVIDNNRLLHVAPGVPIQDAFLIADEVVASAIYGITETVTQPSLINIDFADIRAAMSNQGMGLIAVGDGQGSDKVGMCISETRTNTLLDVDTTKAKGVLVHLTGGPEFSLGEARDIGEGLTDELSSETSVVWGARVDPRFTNRAQAIAIYTGVSPDFGYDL